MDYLLTDFQALILSLDSAVRAQRQPARFGGVFLASPDQVQLFVPDPGQTDIFR